MDVRCECTKAELELFTVPPVNTSMERGGYSQFLPVATLTDSGPIEFHINGSTEEYIDLGRTYLFLRVQVTDKEGEKLEARAKVAPTNLFLHSLFSQVDVHVRDTLISPSVNTYPYKAYLETLLSYGDEAKNTHLSSELFWADHGRVNNFDPYSEDEVNSGLHQRALFIAESQPLELMGRIHSDIFQQDRYLLNNIDLHIKLIRSPTSFHLMGDADHYLTTIKEACLYVRKVKLNPTISLSHSKLLDQGKFAKYPIRRGVVTSFTISQNSLSFNKDSIVSGQLPRRIVLGFVRNAAFNGNIKLNPFNFEHFDLNYLSIHAGSHVVPSQPLKPNFEEKQFLEAYMTLFEGTGIMNADKGNGIRRAHYNNGYTLYAFDLTADMCEGSHLDPVKYGNLRMEVHFAKALPSTINAVIYCEYDNLIQIDRARNVITAFA